MITVYGYRASINVRKVLWALAEVGEAWTLDPVGGGGRPTSDPAFRALNPLGLVPVIDDGGAILRESNAIVRYLAASRGRTDLLPYDPLGRARVEAWMDWQANDFNPTWLPVFRTRVRAATQYTDAEVATSEAAFTTCVGQLDAHLATSGHIAGDAFTVADIPVALGIHRWIATPLEHPPFAHVARYYAAMQARPGFAIGVEGGP